MDRANQPRTDLDPCGHAAHRTGAALLLPPKHRRQCRLLVGPRLWLTRRREPDLPARRFLRWDERAAGRPRIHGRRARVPGRIRLWRDKHDDLRSIVQLMDRRPADVATTLVPDDNQSRRWHGDDLRRYDRPGDQRHDY